MSVEQLESAILALPAADRHRLARWFEDHLHELIDLAEAQAAEAAQEREVRRRLAETEANPAQLQPFEEADVEAMFREFADARAKDSPAR